MNDKNPISLKIYWILLVVSGLCVLLYANNKSATDTEAQQHFEKANELRKLENYDAAITEYKKVINLSPDSKITRNAQYWIGQSYFEAEKFDDALSAFQKLLDEYPESTIVPSTKQMIERVQTAKNTESLFEAVEKGDVQQVKRLIANGANVNATEKVGTGRRVDVTPLISAASEGHTQVVKVLLENGAEVDATCSVGYTALYYALWSVGINDTEGTIKVLISYGADVNKQPPKEDGYSPLIWAIWMCQKHEEIIKALLDAGADLDAKDDNGLSPLYWAAFDSGKEVLDLILERGDYADTIHLAACRGNLSRVKMLIESGIDVNANDEFGCTPLHWAVLAESPEVARFLIDQGADVNVKDARDFTPLMAAYGLPTVELLVSKGADIRSQENRTKLHNACSAGDMQVVKFLIDKGADIHAGNRRGATPLWIASRGGHKEIVELLLKKGAEINLTDRRRNSTPLLIAARKGHADVVEYLIAKGADIHAADNQGMTPLAMARQRGHTKIVELLRQHGAKETLQGAVASGDIDEVKRLLSRGEDADAKKEALLLALNRNRMDMAELLVADGANVNAISDRTGKALLLSVRRRKESLEFLLSKGADTEAKAARDNNGLTLLHSTAAYSNLNNYLDIVKLLLEKGADIETRGHGDTTPLQTAVAVGRKEAAELLLAHGANINARRSKFFGTVAHHAMRENQRDMVRWSISKGVNIPPMHQAAYFGEIGKIRSLLSEGVDVNQEDIAKYTPLHCAVFGRNKEIIQLLLENGADINARDYAYETPLFYACDCGYLDMVKLLVDNGAEVNSTGFRGLHWGPRLMDNWSNLHVAAHKGHNDVVEYLLNNGADIQAKCTRGDGGLTPLHLAARNGRVDVVKVLIAKGADVNLKSKEGRTAMDLAKAAGHTVIVELLKKHGAKE